MTALPASPVRALETAYRERDLDFYASLLTADFLFHSYDETRHQWDRQGFSRERDLAVARCLFRTFPDPECTKTPPPPDTIEVRMKGVRLADDPEHPDSTQHYSLVMADDFYLRLVLRGGEVMELVPAVNVFHVVRGDAAHLVSGQVADSSHWYIRRWIERVSEAGPDGPARPTDPGAATPGVLALRPLANPSNPDLGMWFTLATTASAEMTLFDVQGRHITARALRNLGPGEHHLAIGAGAKLRPGIYWVRLTQPGQQAQTQMVSVR